MRNRVSEIAGDVQVYLAYLKKLGFKGTDCSEQARKKLSSWERIPVRARETLEAVFSDLANCRQCFSGTGRPVAGQGSRSPQLMFVGGWPEPEDEKAGAPFSGSAGELLTRMIAAMDLDRESAYISHAFKCRPAGGKSPGMSDISCCSTFLKREIRILSPRMICALGDLPLQALFCEDAASRRCRGNFREYQGIPVMPTHDPGHLLLHPEAKREAWHDLKKILTLLEKGV
jgi:DNA polymerase